MSMLDGSPINTERLIARAQTHGWCLECKASLGLSENQYAIAEGLCDDCGRGCEDDYDESETPNVDYVECDKCWGYGCLDCDVGEFVPVLHCVGLAPVERHSE